MRSVQRTIGSVWSVLGLGIPLLTVPCWAADPGVPITQPRQPASTILPTDVTGISMERPGPNFAQTLQLKALQFLPANLYITGSCETSLRFESNPFQFPTKRRLLKELPQGQSYFQLNPAQQRQVNSTLRLANRQDGVFRTLPNLTVGWSFTPLTRVYGNYFLIRDSLFHDVRLNTTTQSISYGVQHDVHLGTRANLQFDAQARELFQTNLQPVFDFLPNVTASWVMTPQLLGYSNVTLQLRGKKYFQAPTKELDPFYTVGLLYQRRGWQFNATTTFVQNFRQPFGRNALIQQNNYAIISDFEVARRLFPKVPSMQVFVRAEPIFNMHSRARPGLSGTDFRLFGGIRIAAAKRSLTTSMQRIREDIMQGEQQTR